MENVQFSVLFSLKIYSVEYEQRSVMRSGDWVQFPRVTLIYLIFFLCRKPLPRKSIRKQVVFKDTECNRGSSLTLTVGHKPVRNEPNFVRRKREKVGVTDDKDFF